MDYQITAVHIGGSREKEEHITHIQLVDGTEETIEKAIASIDEGKDYYYRVDGGEKVRVDTVHPEDPNTPAYLRTHPDQSTTDNLLKLPTFEPTYTP